MVLANKNIIETITLYFAKFYKTCISSVNNFLTVHPDEESNGSIYKEHVKLFFYLIALTGHGQSEYFFLVFFSKVASCPLLGSCLSGTCMLYMSLVSCPLRAVTRI